MKLKIILILLLASCSKKEEPIPSEDIRRTVYIQYSFWSNAHQGYPAKESARVYNLTKGSFKLDIEYKNKMIIFDGHDTFKVVGKVYEDIDTLTIWMYSNGKLKYKGIGYKQKINAEL